MLFQHLSLMFCAARQQLTGRTETYPVVIDVLLSSTLNLAYSSTYQSESSRLPHNLGESIDSMPRRTKTCVAASGGIKKY